MAQMGAVQEGVGRLYNEMLKYHGASMAALQSIAARTETNERILMRIASMLGDPLAPSRPLLRPPLWPLSHLLLHLPSCPVGQWRAFWGGFVSYVCMCLITRVPSELRSRGLAWGDLGVLASRQAISFRALVLRFLRFRSQPSSCVPYLQGWTGAGPAAATAAWGRCSRGRSRSAPCRWPSRRSPRCTKRTRGSRGAPRRRPSFIDSLWRPWRGDASECCDHPGEVPVSVVLTLEKRRQ